MDDECNNQSGGSKSPNFNSLADQYDSEFDVNKFKEMLEDAVIETEENKSELYDTINVEP